jgi:hypothetical protein
MTNRFAHPAGLAATTALLAVALSTPAAAGTNTIRFRLSTTGIDADARAGIEYDATPGAEKFRLKVADLPPGAYTLLLNGGSAATFNVFLSSSGTRGSIRLNAADGSLGFNPFGASLGITDGTTLFLNGTFPASLAEGGLEETVVLDLLSTGTDADASGNMEQRDKQGRRTIKLLVDKLPQGSYELRLGGVLLGFVDTNGQGRGTIKFSTQPNDAGFDGDDYLPLTFDPSGQEVTVELGGTVYLSALFPGQGGGCAGPGCNFDPTGGTAGANR